MLCYQFTDPEGVDVLVVRDRPGNQTQTLWLMVSQRHATSPIRPRRHLSVMNHPYNSGETLQVFTSDICCFCIALTYGNSTAHFPLFSTLEFVNSEPQSAERPKSILVDRHLGIGKLPNRCLMSIAKIGGRIKIWLKKPLFALCSVLCPIK